MTIEQSVELGPAIAAEPASALPSFVCPRDRGPLQATRDGLACDSCGQRYPIVRGIPILLNEDNSVFRIADFAGASQFEGASGYGGSLDRTRGLRRLYHNFGHWLFNTAPRSPFTGRTALTRIQSENPQARILIIGAGEASYPGNALHTDVAFGANVRCICDAHDLPFEDGSFDAVFANAVLEHVADPQRCVAEIHRVLRAGGYVYAVTPFMHPVHMGAYDFTRFTYLGHRRLFRSFDELSSGVAGGPGHAGAYYLRHMMLGIADRSGPRKILRLLGGILSLPVLYMDPWFNRRQSAYDTASATYFFGTRRDSPIPDREILKYYRGGFPRPLTGAPFAGTHN